MLTRGDDVSMKKVIAFLLTLALLLLYVLPTRDSSVLDPLQVKFIDVGQGDAILLQCGGQSLLIDGGPAEAQQNLYKAIKKESNIHLLAKTAVFPAIQTLLWIWHPVTLSSYVTMTIFCRRILTRLTRFWN